MNTDKKINEITEKIIGCAFTVSNVLGAGFLEKVYENSLAHEMRKAGLTVEQQKEIPVTYDGVVVGEYFADLLVNDSVIVEMKAITAFEDAHFTKCINYLKATGKRVCLLMNFGLPKVQIKRIIL